MGEKEEKCRRRLSTNSQDVGGGGLCWLVNGEGAGPRHGAKDVLAVLTPPVIVVGSPVK